MRATRFLLAIGVALLAGCLDVAGGGPADNERSDVAQPDLVDDIDVDLLRTPFDQTWTFDFAAGAQGSVSVNLASRMQGLVDPSACVLWERTWNITLDGPGQVGNSHGRNTGTSGDCGNNGSSIFLDPDHLASDHVQVHHWDGDDLKEGHYVVRVTAPAQAHRLQVHFDIDNLPLTAD